MPDKTNRKVRSKERQLRSRLEVNPSGVARRPQSKKKVAMSGRAPSPDQIIRKALAAVETGGAVHHAIDINAKPHYGTTVFIATCTLEMRMGTFQAYVFQDLIHKGYIVALAFGDIHRAKVLYTRLHSSCVTSETLRGCDCDCSKQLEGALRRITDRGAGILFYLIQEGRGVGYVAKARDRMLVQAGLDQISTFEAYAAMGLKKDYRNYEGIASIIHLLGVRASFRVLTNNPDKVEALKTLGVRIDGTESIEFDPGPYNLAYLKSKAESGHVLARSTKSQLRSAIPPEPVSVFNPYALPGAYRFIYCASYFLPMKPVDGEVIVSREAYNQVASRVDLPQYLRGSDPLIREIVELDDSRMLVRMERRNFARYRDNAVHADVVQFVTSPYWFKVHAYYDIATGQDFVVLTHGYLETAEPQRTPIVRVHSESIFDRFPLVDVENRDKLKASAKMIVRHGYGVMVLLYNDGRGAGFGAHATDRMFRARGVAESSDEVYERLGLPYDSRDYDAAMALIAHHVPSRCIQMIMNGPDSLVRKQEYAIALHQHKLKVSRWIFLDNE